MADLIYWRPKPSSDTLSRCEGTTLPQVKRVNTLARRARFITVRQGSRYVQGESDGVYKWPLPGYIRLRKPHRAGTTGSLGRPACFSVGFRLPVEAKLAALGVVVVVFDLEDLFRTQAFVMTS